MIKVVGVRFRNSGKVYYFDPKELDIHAGSPLIVETARGLECGRAVLAPREVDESRVVQPLREVIRLATDRDLEQERNNREKEREAFRLCKKKIREHNLDMKLIQAEYTFDHKKVLFYFTADGRVDFRDLVRDLASVFRTRIELRQIGVRDETKILGGIGICGRQLCCNSYLPDFAPVSIKMAKEQNLSLNPTKISGVCGRLLCCLKNEQETYQYLNRQLPGNGDLVETSDGVSGEIHSINVLRQSVRVLFEEGDNKEIREYPASEVTVTTKRKNRHRDKEREAKRLAAESAEASHKASGHGDHDRAVKRERRRPEKRELKDFETMMQERDESLAAEETAKRREPRRRRRRSGSRPDGEARTGGDRPE